MLRLSLSAKEEWDPTKGEFINIKATTLVLEHSLVSLSKWESKHEKSFLENVNKLDHSEIIDYIKCMTISQNVDDRVYDFLSQEDIKSIIAYIEAPMTATTFNDKNQTNSKKEVMTAEIFYYYMTALNIPFECQKWHLNRLLTLIRVCAIKSQPEKKMSAAENRSWRKAQNAARRAKLGSRG